MCVDAESSVCRWHTDGGGSLAGELHVLQSGLRSLVFVPHGEVQVQRRTLGLCSSCCPLECPGGHGSDRERQTMKETEEEDSRCPEESRRTYKLFGVGWSLVVLASCADGGLGSGLGAARVFSPGSLCWLRSVGDTTWIKMFRTWTSSEACGETLSFLNSGSVQPGLLKEDGS